MNNKLPSNVRGVTVQNDHLERFSPPLANWALLHPFLRDEVLTARQLQIMMAMEHDRAPGPRFHIMKRLMGKFNNLRRDEEWNEFVDYYDKLETQL